MRCAACGQLVLEGTKYCPSCGAKIEEQTGFQETVDVAFTETDSGEQTYEQTAPQEESAYTVYEHNYTHQPEMPMKWYKFLIYVTLVLTCISNIFIGVQTIMGYQYIYDGVDMSEQVYAQYGGMQIVDIVYGLALVAMGVLAFIVRQKLAHYRKDGPKSLLILYGVSFALSVVYLIVVTLITGINLLDVSLVTNLIVTIVMMIVNKIYFDKRMHLFTE